MMYGRKATVKSRCDRAGIFRRPRMKLVAGRTGASVGDFDGVPTKELNTRDLFPHAARFLRNSWPCTPHNPADGQTVNREGIMKLQASPEPRATFAFTAALINYVHVCVCVCVFYGNGRVINYSVRTPRLMIAIVPQLQEFCIFSL